jgi:DNA polymerase
MTAAAEAERAALESLLAFWVDAGVDAAFEDSPIDRLAAREPARLAKPAQAASTPRAIAGEQRPRDHAGPAPVAPRPAPQAANASSDPRRLAAEAQDLEALAAAIAAFDGCPLKTQGARQAVFARGRPDAPVLVIGEGPGAEEDEVGQPFVGRAGRLLDKMLAAAGLTDQVFITNTVFWRPPGNRTPSPAEQLACAPFVERAIALVKPRFLLLAGGAAAKSVLQRSEGILSMHGRWFDWTSADGSMTIPALPTLHPSFLLRQPAAKKKAWSDLLILTERLGAP